jgi:hypothetical protein
MFNFSTTEQAAKIIPMDVVLNGELLQLSEFAITTLFAKSYELGTTADETLTRIVLASIAGADGADATEKPRSILIGGEPFELGHWPLLQWKARAYYEGKPLEGVINEWIGETLYSSETH